MNANFSPRHSRSSCYLAPTPPRRKRSNDLDRILRSASVPTHLQCAPACCTDERASLADPRNTIFSESIAPRRGRLQREKRSMLTITTSSSMMFDHASQQRTAATKANSIPRAISCDMKPSLPTRKATPIKSRPSTETNFSWHHHSNSVSKPVNHEKDDQDEEERSAAIRKPTIKRNVFLQIMSSSPAKEVKSNERRNNRDLLPTPPLPKHEFCTPPNKHVKTLRLQRSPNSVLEETRPSPAARKEHVMSRWESSPLLSSAPSCFAECFADHSSRIGSRKQTTSTRNES